MNQEDSSKSIFRYVESTQPDPIFSLNAEFNEDPRPGKINLTIGYYAADNGSQPTILQAIAEASRELLSTESTKNYLPIGGDKHYVEEVRKLVFGDLTGDRTLGLGTAGGTGAIRMIAEFAYNQITRKVCFSSPTWPNHIQIFSKLGYEIDYYPYELESKREFSRILDHLSGQPKGTLILFQPMSHNPTGCDFTAEEWRELSYLCKEKGLTPFFDSAYQGLGKGFVEDVWPIRLFVQDGHELFVAHSFSKSMGLYGERTGAAFVVMHSNKHQEDVKNRMSLITRTQYSNPPRHGELLALLVLSNHARKSLWEKEVDQMRERVDRYRHKLAAKYAELAKVDVGYITEGHGFFCRLCLSKEQVVKLKNEQGIYLGGGGRINLAAFLERNFDRVLKGLEQII